MGVGGAVVAAGAYGLLAGWWTPRGPVTSSQALAAIALGLVVGVFTGAVMRTRWAMLLAPVIFVVVFELARSGMAGATTAGIHLGSTYRILAFAVGRGIHGVLALVPMMLGATLGAAATRHIDDRPATRYGPTKAGLWIRRGVTALVTVGLLALAAAIIRPAGTEPSSALTASRWRGASPNLPASTSAATASP